MTNLTRMEKIYKAVANRKRLHILVFLKMKKSATVNSIAKNIGLKKQSASKHLQILENAGFLVKRKRGLFVSHRISSALKKEQKNILSSL